MKLCKSAKKPVNCSISAFYVINVKLSLKLYVQYEHHIFIGTVAFETDLDAYISIPLDSYVIFDQIHVNIGDG